MGPARQSTILAPLTPEEALAILQMSESQLPPVLAAAMALRREKFGRRARLCSILNAKCGLCSEDCIYCAQSGKYRAAVLTFPLRRREKIVEAYDVAATLPVEHFGVVTSGRALSDAEIDRIIEAMGDRSDGNVHWCASLGTLNIDQFRRLKVAGLKRYHHNLETAASYFPCVCTTHTYADRVRTIRAARDAELEVCAGGLFGLGESLAQRVELAFALKELDVESIPLNFLVPIPNTPAADATPLTPLEILKTIAMFRLVCRDAEIKVCAGREKHLGDAESLIYFAGATGMMIGGYLTTRGRSVEQDLKLLRQAGMCVDI